MTVEELREEISVELESIETVLAELRELQNDLKTKDVSVREKTAAAAFLAQFYNGVENILKRINHFYGVPLATGAAWHVDLFKRFCQPPQSPLPALFDESLKTAITPFRQFRHVFFHGYGFQLDWNRMHEGVASVDDICERFKSELDTFLYSLENS